MSKAKTKTTIDPLDKVYWDTINGLKAYILEATEVMVADRKGKATNLKLRSPETFLDKLASFGVDIEYAVHNCIYDPDNLAQELAGLNVLNLPLKIVLPSGTYKFGGVQDLLEYKEFKVPALPRLGSKYLDTFPTYNEYHEAPKNKSLIDNIEQGLKYRYPFTSDSRFRNLPESINFNNDPNHRGRYKTFAISSVLFKVFYLKGCVNFKVQWGEFPFEKSDILGFEPIPLTDALTYNQFIDLLLPHLETKEKEIKAIIKLANKNA